MKNVLALLLCAMMLVVFTSGCSKKEQAKQEVKEEMVQEKTAVVDSTAMDSTVTEEPTEETE